MGIQTLSLRWFFSISERRVGDAKAEYTHIRLGGECGT